MLRRTRLAVVAGGLGVLAVGAAVVTVVVMAVMLFVGAGSDDAPAAQSDAGCGRAAAPAVPVLDPGPRVATLDAEQTRNARTIVRVASSLSSSAGLDAPRARQAAVVGIMTAMQESTLRNIGYGDRDSLGLFQQRAAWASAADRTTPSTAATMFFTGGHGGQRGLFDIGGWTSMPLWAAAQAVQVSAFPTAYAKWERLARATVGALLGGGGGGAPAAPATIDVVPAVCDAAQPAQPAANAKGWVLPLPAGSFTPTSPFGWRLHPILHDWRLHTGQDLGAAQGTPVFAVATGKVVAAGPNGGYGNQVVVRHGGGVDSAYNHLSTIVVPAGAQVTAGQLVGRVGTTGLSTAPHLHLEIRTNGQPIDPVPFLRARGVDLIHPRA